MQLLGALLVLVTLAVAFAPRGGAAGSFYAWVLTALGNPAPDSPGDRPVDAVVGGVGLLAGGVALGLAISLMSAYFIDRRLTETSFRRARFLRNHVVVVGLGDVGLRTSQLLDRLGVPFCVVDPSVGAVAETAARAARHIGGAPVLSGSLAEALEAAGVERAAAVIACGENNLLNVEACLRAKRHSRARTVARIFDDDDAERCARIFGVDRRLAAVEAAAPVFADAAVHVEAVRSFGGPEAPMLCLRWPSGLPIGRVQMEGWREQGVRLLALWRHGEGARRPPAESPGLAEEEAGILAGPAEAMEGVLDELRRRTGGPVRSIPTSRP
jgi:voltage-gated potassium channel Kch